MIYLDHAAMTPPIDASYKAFRDAPFGNPSSEHAVGQAARDAMELAREKIARLMDCDSNDVYFVSTATEGAALAAFSLAQRGYAITTSGTEHHAVSENANAFRFKHPDCWPTEVYGWMLANNETGERLSPPAIAPGSSELWLCDATAAVGHIPVSFKTLGCDYLIADAIKFGGYSSAFLIAKHGAPLSPLIRGGGQEHGIRSGTENVPAICAMAAALEWQTEHMEENTAKLSKLSEILVTELSKIPGHLWNTPLDKPRLPHILNISFVGVDAHALALLLSKMGVMISAGAACSNGLHEPSHVIMAMFHDEARARSAIRISLSHQNTEEQAKLAAVKIAEAVAYLRSLN